MFKKVMSLLTAVAVIIAGIQFTPANKVNAAVTSSGGSKSWKLVWSEDFNGNVGSGVDTSVWNYDTGNSGWGNNEIQNYTTSTNNVYIADTIMGIRSLVTADVLQLRHREKMDRLHQED